MGPDVYVKVEGLGWVLMTNTVSATADSYSIRQWKSIELLRSLCFTVLPHWPAFWKMWFHCTVSWCQGFPYILCWGFHTYCIGVSIHTVWGFSAYCAGISIQYNTTLLSVCREICFLSNCHIVPGFPYILCRGFRAYYAGISTHIVPGFPYILRWGFHTYCAGVSILAVLEFPYILYWGY